MKLTGLFRKETNKPEVTEEEFKESLVKLWQFQYPDLFTADKAREMANNKLKNGYLDVNVIGKILEKVLESACRHRTSCSGSIGSITLSDDEINYCVRFLDHIGYKNITIFNVSDPNVFPESVEYSLSW